VHKIKAADISSNSTNTRVITSSHGSQCQLDTTPQTRATHKATHNGEVGSITHQQQKSVESHGPNETQQKNGPEEPPSCS
jgi:hypothetical protein